MDSDTLARLYLKSIVVGSFEKLIHMAGSSCSAQYEASKSPVQNSLNR